MAYASVASLIQTIHLVNYHHGDSSISSRFKAQLTSLQEHATVLQSFLEDDPKRANNWEETIREVTDVAEEIIDLLVSDSLLKSGVVGSKSEKVKPELHYSFDELDRVTEEMESTVNRVKGKRIKAVSELMQIITLLREGSSKRETIGMVGQTGIKASNLARSAYNHPWVKEHFDVRAWFEVRYEYSGPDIIRDLLQCINVESVGEPIETLRTSLCGKRYLIVLNDVWTKQAWEDIVIRVLPDNENGSRIILTSTYFDLVAETADHIHVMGLMDEDKSWNMLRELIFGGEPCPSQLESIGKTIARRCRGFPLAIKVVSGILADDQTKANWEDISENMSDEPNAVLYQLLPLSFKYLPRHLRPCFQYFRCFMKGNKRRVSKLIKLWVAEGFLKQSEHKSFEETGEECVEDLVRRGLVLVRKRKSDGKIKSIALHFAIHDWFHRAMSSDNFVTRSKCFDQLALALELEPSRRVSISNVNHDFLEGLYDSTIRSIRLYVDKDQQGIRCSLGNVSLLRILDLSNAYSYDLPEEVFELFHLRYLAFHCGFSISEAISNLQNLQTLIVYQREKGRVLDNLPVGIWRMPQLRHLLMSCFSLPSHKEATSPLENLQTLSKVVDFVCSKQNLSMIPHVKKLNVFYTERFKDVVEDIELHNLISLHKLEILKIEMEWSSPVENHTNKMSFAFPPTLKRLNLCGVQLLWEDMKIVASLPNLEVLKLRNHTCIGETWETSEGGFSRLTYLMIKESDLEEWITGSSHFPKLKSLVLRSCLHLSKVPHEMGEIPTLQLIELDGESQTLVNSAKRIQEDRQMLGDEVFQVLVLE